MKLRAILVRMRDPVTGNLRLTGVESAGRRYRLEGVVSAVGMQPTPVSVLVRKRWSHFVDKGQNLPILVDRARPTRFRINWDGVPSFADLVVRSRKHAMDEMARLLDEEMAAGAFPLTAASWQNLAASGGMQDDLADAIGRAFQEIFGVQMNGSFEVIHTVFDRARFERADAEIVAVNEAHLPGGVDVMFAGGIVDLSLDITRADGTRYSAQTRVGFNSPGRRAIDSVGTRLGVLIDPADPGNVVIGQ